ncbi:hypothetical protein M3221_13320 [Domibacillus indicus]|uniref:hypothetical protein n=1 Tax=Domibacillus indicus TaxID=1437523 RepID=UPI00203ABDDF|nr:hypothetical protein [Domibacillus indicus]MCM3789380.1 hypothetical protein [Domibacillus indicus]
MLGHSDKENIARYLKNDKRKIFQLRTALTEIEEELEGALQQKSDKEQSNKLAEVTAENETKEVQSNGDLNLSADELMRIYTTHPDLFKKLVLANNAAS